MKLHWTDWAVAIVLAGAAGMAGCIAIWAGLTRAMRRAISEKQQDTDRQLMAMATTVKALQARVAELSGAQTAQGGDASVYAPAEDAAAPMNERTEPQTVAVLTAAATAFVGKKARVRSAQPLPAEQDSAGAWAQQGRVFVQASHNLRSRG